MANAIKQFMFEVRSCKSETYTGKKFQHCDCMMCDSPLYDVNTIC